jgi:hypothetical protein
MFVIDFDGEVSLRSQTNLERQLTFSRKGRYGAFILSHRKGGPELWIQVSKDVAYLHYFPDADYLVHAGYQPTGMTPAGCKRKVRFRVLASRSKEFGGTYVTMPPDNLVSMTDAVVAAKEFFKDATLPRSIRWLAL